MADWRAAPWGIDPHTGVAYARARPLDFLYWPGSRASLLMLALVSAANALLAAFLFLAGAAMLRDGYEGARRHAWFIVWKVPLLVAGAIASIWWVQSLRDYASLPTTIYERWMLLALLSISSWVYPLAIILVVCSRRVDHYFVNLSQDPWGQMRPWLVRVRSVLGASRGRLVMALAVLAMGMLGAAHVVVAIWCLVRSSSGEVQGVVHLLGAAVSLTGAALAVAVRAHAGRRAASTMIRLAVLIGFILLAPPTLAQLQFPTTAPVTPWTVGELIGQARSPDLERAARAVRALAVAGAAGQEGLLQLLDGPEPEIGVPAILQIIGEQWFDTDIRWSANLWRRALRLTPEWIEIIRDSDDVRSIAALEAMGPSGDLEPLLRPLLTSPKAPVGKRSAEFLLRINPRPAGMVRLLRLELNRTHERAGRNGIISALVNLRPTSDSTLAQLIDGQDRQLGAQTVSRLIEADQPLSIDLVDVVVRRAESEDSSVHLPAMQLLCLDKEGRARLIALSLSSAPTAPAARRALVRLWTVPEPVFWPMFDDTKGASARRAVLEALNESGMEGVARLTNAENDALQALSRLVLANGQYGTLLGPHTYRLVAGVERAAPAVSWAIPDQRHPRAPLPTPPVWFSGLLWLLTVLVPCVIPVTLYALACIPVNVGKVQSSN
jgi:hypothetical protein